MKIKTLNQEVINQIAAGEVIVQPASIVKELIENSIDAKANRIEISIRNGGKKEIIINDNGVGINYDDIPLAFKRHATSKINYLSDLEDLSTMGFRGEALSSIAAVAKVTIITRARDEELGSKTYFENGNLIEQSVYPFEEGTSITVADLFENIPARYKFLKSDKKEEAIIRDIVEKLALSHPDISFSYTNNEKKIFKTPGNNSLTDTAFIIFGGNFSKHLYPFETENLPMKIYGLIGDLDARRTYRDNQIFFLNGRYIKSNLLSRAYEEEWEGKLMKHQYPSGIIFIDLPSYMIDVNVHPQKIEVNILNKTLVTLLFKQCIRQVLEDLDLIPKFIENELVIEEPVDEPKTEYKIDLEQEKFDLNNVPKKNEKQDINYSQSSVSIKNENILTENTNSADTSNNNSKFLFENLTLIGVLFDTYILLEDADTFYIIDQHAAHEAILYDQYNRIINSNNSFDSQRIIPHFIEVTNKELESFNKVKGSLNKFGFQADLEDNKIKVSAVPVILNIEQNPKLIISMLNYLDNISSNRPDYGLSKVISMSCKEAIKAGNKISKAEIKTLLSNLSQIDNPYTCPHGRPVIQKRSQHEIEKLFKRIV